MKTPGTLLPKLMILGVAAGLVGLGEAHGQQMVVQGRVLHNPSMSDCWQEVPCTRDLEMTRDEEWVPTPAAVNVVVQGTDIVTKTDRDGYYQLTVPSPDASLMFLYLGHNRIEVPVEGQSDVDVRLTPTPLPVLDRLLGEIMPRLHADQYPNIDELAAAANVNRETARDVLWLVIGNRTMAREYPGEYIPDYRFDDSVE